MKTIFTVTSTGYCIVEDAYYAYNGLDQTPITKEQKLEIDWKIKQSGSCDIEIVSTVTIELTEAQEIALKNLIEMHMSYLVEHDVENDSPLNNFVVFEDIYSKLNPDYLS